MTWANKPLVKFIVFSNLHVATGAALLTLESSLQLFNTHASYYPVLLVFFATLFIYNYQRIIAFHVKNEAYKSVRHSWIDRHKKLLLIFTLLSGCGALLLAILLGVEKLLLLAPLGLLAFFYATPFYRRKGKWIRLRELPFSKIILIGLVWAGVTVWTPMVYESTGTMHVTLLAWVLFAAQFLFIVAITIPFDIRDMAIDRFNNVVTLPLYFGMQKSKQLAYLLMCVHLALYAYLLFTLQINAFVFSAIAVIDTVTCLCIKHTSSQKEELYFSFAIDGLMILKPLLYLISRCV